MAITATVNYHYIVSKGTLLMYNKIKNLNTIFDNFTLRISYDILCSKIVNFFR